MEVLLLHTRMDRKQAWDRAVELLNLVGVSEPAKRMKQFPHEFSGGMRQRVMIAMALACEPKLLIADEPTTALDVTIQAQIFELIAELKEKLNMAIMLITHDLGVVADICERIIIMYAGKIVEYGSVRDIFYRHTHPYTSGLFNSLPRLDSDIHQRLIPIEGSPVDLLNPPAGCPFAPRCPKCMKVCLHTPPPYVEVNEEHYSACWLLLKDQAGSQGEEATP
jgi:oligopeptide transport system ATP-binding protein